MRASPNQLAPSRSVESAGWAETGTGLTGALKRHLPIGVKRGRAQSQKLWFHYAIGSRSARYQTGSLDRNAQTASGAYSVYLTGHGHAMPGGHTAALAISLVLSTLGSMACWDCCW